MANFDRIRGIVYRACNHLGIGLDTFIVNPNNTVHCEICDITLNYIHRIRNITDHVESDHHRRCVLERDNPGILLRLEFENAVRDLPNGIYRFHDGLVYCDLCHTRIQIQSIHYHHQSQYHGKNAELHATEPRPTASAYDACSPHQNGFTMELVDAFLAANIPLDKLNNEVLRKFLEKWTRHIIPQSSVRKTYVKKSFEHKLELIRNEIGESRVELFVDETTDASGNKAVHAVVRPLLPDYASKPRLIYSQHLANVDGDTIREFVMDSLAILWPRGIHHDRVLIYNSDGVRYMSRSAEMLRHELPKLVHVKCTCHACHLLAESVRQQHDDENLLISDVKKIFSKSPNRVAIFRAELPGIPLPPKPVITRWATWLRAAIYFCLYYIEVGEVIAQFNPVEAECIADAQQSYEDNDLLPNFQFIAANYEIIANTVISLEKINLSLNNRIRKIERLREQLQMNPDIPAAIKQRLTQVFNDNPGYETMRQINNCLQNGIDKPVVPGWTVEDQKACRFATLTTADVERSFKNYKKTYACDRRSFLAENLGMHLVISSFLNGFVLDDDNVDEEDDDNSNVDSDDEIVDIMDEDGDENF